MSNSIDEKVLKEIRLTNRLMANMLVMDKETQIEKVLTLSGCGFSPSNIAEILGMKINHVTSYISRSRKAKEVKKVAKKKAVEKHDVQGT